MMNRNIALLSVSLMLAANMASAEEPLSQAAAQAHELISALPAAAMGRAPAAQTVVPAGHSRRQFSIKATLYSESTILAQPAVLSVAFDLETTPNINRERMIRNLDFTLELAPEGSIPMPRYTMSSLGPKSQLDFYPPDPKWGQNQLTYAEEKGGQVQFFIEARSNIDARASGTVLDGAVKRLDNGQVYGAKAMLKIYPYCTPDLSTCSLGQIAGITYDHWGLGWFNDRVYPDYRLLSEQNFSLAQ